jgi:hypothetical protein
MRALQRGRKDNGGPYRCGHPSRIGVFFFSSFSSHSINLLGFAQDANTLITYTLL